MTESYFDILKRHGVKLSLAMLLGNLLHTALLYAAIIVYVILALILSLIFTMDVSALGTDSDQFAENLASEPGGVILGVILALLLIPVIQLPNSFFTAGSYGAASASVFRGEWSFGYFFSAGFKNLWRMFGQQVLLALIFIGPILLLILISGPLVADEEGSEALLAIFAFLFIILAFALLIGYLWVSLHAPLILLVEQTGVWESIRLAFRLTLKKPGQTLLSGLIALGILMGAYLAAILIAVILILLPTAITGSEIVGAIFGLFGGLIVLFAIFYAFAASLLIIVHRYKTRLRNELFPEEMNWEGVPGGATPGYVPHKP